MTIGNVFQTYSLGPYDEYSYRKVWNGTNGKYTGGVLNWNPYSMYTHYGRQHKGSGGGWPSYLEYYPTPDANLVNDALNRLLEAVKGHSFNAGVFAGESKKTLELVTDTITRFARGVRYLRKGRVDLALRALGAQPKKQHKKVYREAKTPLRTTDVSALWLEIQYGWRPLISDVYEAMKAYEAATNQARKTRVVGRATKKWSWVQYLYGGMKGYHESQTAVKYAVELQEQLSTPRSLGLEDPASIAWELVPLSFVADWFIPIGTYLENLAQIPKINGRFFQTNVGFDTYQCPGSCSGAAAVYFCGAWSRGRSFIYSRSTPTSPAIPRPNFVGFKEGISAGKRIYNSIALFHQVLK